jgi:hypothetical protein
MAVKIFDLREPVLAALQASLSPERFGTYLAAAAGDRVEAMRLYTWNTTLSAAFYGPLQGLEIAVRNAMHRELTRVYGFAWYDNPSAGLDAGTLDRIHRAKDELRRGQYAVDPPHLVAALTFGFWVSLLGRGGRSPNQGGPKQDYERTLWRPALTRAFPHARLARADAQKRLDFLRTFRNRIAHHEPIFGRHLAADHDSILLVTAWISPDIQTWIAHHSRVPQLLAMPRDAAAASF